MREADKSGGQEKEGEPLAARSIRCQHCRGSARTRDRIMDGAVRRASEADAEVLTLLNTDVQKPGRLPEALADVFPALDHQALSVRLLRGSLCTRSGHSNSTSSRSSSATTSITGRSSNVDAAFADPPES